MQGAAMTRDIRRTGVSATKGGEPESRNTSTSVFEGPTEERLAKADNHYTVGDDKPGDQHRHDAG